MTSNLQIKAQHKRLTPLKNRPITVNVHVSGSNSLRCGLVGDIIPPHNSLNHSNKETNVKMTVTDNCCELMC